MARHTVEPNGWIAVRLPTEDLRVFQVIPHTSISLGKYGSFPSNLIIGRPYHLTYEVQEKREGENFSRLRVVPASELNAAALEETDENENSNDPTPKSKDGDDVIEATEGEELTLVDESGRVIVRSNRETIDDRARQTLTAEEIEELKKKGSGAGKDLIAKLLLSHTAIEEKTAYSLAKYKLLKTKKYIRRFTVLPLDVATLAQWLLEDKDSSKTLEMRAEALGLVGCHADVHWSEMFSSHGGSQGGRWLTVDDTGGLLVATMAERMGLLHRSSEKDDDDDDDDDDDEEDGEKEEDDTRPGMQEAAEEREKPVEGEGEAAAETEEKSVKKSQQPQLPERKKSHRDDFEIPFATANTITVIYPNSQPNLSTLRYFNYEAADPNPSYPYHPLFTNVLPISWLQLVAPEEDPTYSEVAPDADAETLATFRTARRGNYHRKRRRWARTQHIVNSTREGGFSGLAVASTMDPISILRHALPLLAGGAPVAIYSQSVEPLSALADCFSVGRRAAWVSSPPAEAEGKSVEELTRWEGTEEYPLNPTLLLGASVQTSRARRWQVLPGRTHPMMTSRGGSDGYIFTAWRAVPVEGKIAARGKFKRKRQEGS